MSWIRPLRRARSTPSHGRSWRLRPQVELLEARRVPSTVMNLNDSGPGSLRDAIATTAAGGTVDFQPGLSGVITLTSGPLTVAKDLTINGPGPGFPPPPGSDALVPGIAVSGNHSFQVFIIAAGNTVTISGLTVTQGSATNGAAGGGIANAGTLTLDNVDVFANTALGLAGAALGLGGGIDNTGTLTLTDCTVSRNQATGADGSGPDLPPTEAFGGGIRSSGSLTISASSITNNSATGGRSLGTLVGGQAAGGGVYNVGTLMISASNFTGNTATAPAGGSFQTAGGAAGGAVFSTGMVTAVNSTVYQNTATVLLFGNGQARGGGFDLEAGSAVLTNVTVAGNEVNNSSLPAPGGGLAAGSALVVLQNTLVATNLSLDSRRQTQSAGIDFSPASDVGGGVSPTSSHNLLGVGLGSGLTAGVNGNRVGLVSAPINPRLIPLAQPAPAGAGPAVSVIGTNPPIGLMADSPAVDAGDNSLSPGSTDQRGLPRIANAEIDIGAYEYQPPPSFVPIFVTGGAPDRVQVRRIPDGAVLYDFAPYPAPYAGSVSVAVGDVNGDGYPDVITGAAVGNPHVKVFDGRAFALGTFDPNNPDASLLASFFAYGTGFNIGANVAVGDVSGNGFADIVTGATAGNPDVHVYKGLDIATHSFDPNGASLLAHWFAYGLNFNIGANVAVGDVNADGYGDVVTGATAGNAHVKVYDGRAVISPSFNPDLNLLASFLIPNTLGQNYGAYVAVGDANGDGYGDPIVGLSLSPDVYVYDGRAIAGGTFDNNNPGASQLTHFTAYPAHFPDGVSVGAADFEADGKADIVTGLTGQSSTLAVVDGLATGIGPPAINGIRYVIFGIQSGLYVSA